MAQVTTPPEFDELEASIAVLENELTQLDALRSLEHFDLYRDKVESIGQRLRSEIQRIESEQRESLFNEYKKEKNKDK